jgi:hypothetical protein
MVNLNEQEHALLPKKQPSLTAAAPVVGPPPPPRKCKSPTSPRSQHASRLYFRSMTCRRNKAVRARRRTLTDHRPHTSVLLAPGGVFGRVVGWVLDIARRKNVAAMNLNFHARGIRILAQGGIGGVRARVACVADAVVFSPARVRGRG